MPSPRSAPPSPSVRWSFCGNLRPSPSSASTATGQARRPPRAPSTACCRICARVAPSAFAFLPEGSDPDDLVRSKGARALAECLAGARPLIDVLWQRELKTHPIDTPERRACFRGAAGEAARRDRQCAGQGPLSPRGEEPAVQSLARAGNRSAQAAGRRRRHAVPGQSERHADPSGARLHHRHDHRAGQSPLAARQLRR